jgi:hypothetical protein
MIGIRHPLQSYVFFLQSKEASTIDVVGRQRSSTCHKIRDGAYLQKQTNRYKHILLLI